MKIRAIGAAGLVGGTPAGGWADELKPDDVVHTLIAVHTDEGLTGLGSAFTSDRLVRAGLELLEPLCLGESALEPERVSERLHQSTFWLGRGGTLTHVISGIDIALWDLLGQVTGQPVGRLLGGRYRSRVRPYASVLMVEPAVLRDSLAALAHQGFTAFKIGWGQFGRTDAAADEATVRTARGAVGPGSLLMVDAGGSEAFWPNGYKWARRTADMLAEYEVEWFEEPLAPDLIDDYRRLREAAPVKISTGETLTRRQAFVPWLQGGAVDIIQPDVTKVGGLSEQRQIGWMAQANGIRLIPHGWNTAIGLAADLQLASALPGTDLVEYKVGAPYIDDIVTERWRIDADGMLSIPEDPGLGVRLDHDKLAAYCPDINALGLSEQ